MTETFDITPSTRILRMLGEIDFSAVQCLCELIDNSIDAFDSDVKPSLKKPTITINTPSIPKSGVLSENDSISVQDNGFGMSEEELNRSLKAGFSSNDPTEKMGLFGMGFNIATARLGGRTEIVTFRKEDNHCTRVVIDFRELEETGKFKVPVTQETKTNDQVGKSGTIVSISKLNLPQLKSLRSAPAITKRLGKTYRRIIRNQNLIIKFNSITCTPFNHCTWDKSRNGTNKGEQIPAIIEFDELINSKRFCTSCWVWLSETAAVCGTCGTNDSIKQRERRVRGWIGVQRYFDKQHYGFDLIRNGRVIQELDKSFFFCTTPQGEKDLEYPIDGHGALGRFVGEIEMDFVPVTHQKDSFQDGDDWNDAKRVVRGDGPIRPQIAAQWGHPTNKTPLAVLFSAFRNAKGGIANLVPKRRSSGKAMISDDIIRDYVKRFDNGETDFQSDEKWWELILEGEVNSPSPTSTPGTPSGPAGVSPFAPQPTTVPPSTAAIEPAGSPTNSSDGVPDTQLSNVYSIDLYGDLVIAVKAFRMDQGSHERGFEVDPKGREIQFRYWPDSPIYAESFIRPEEFLINELAYQFSITASSSTGGERFPISWIERSIRQKYFQDLSPDFSRLETVTKDFSDEIRSHLKDTLPSIASFDFASLDEVAMDKVRHNLIQKRNLDRVGIDRAIKSGEFLTYAELPLLIEIFSIHPQCLFDGEFFKLNFNETGLSENLKKEKLNEAIELFGDLTWLLNNSRPENTTFWRGRIRRVTGAIDILLSWKA